MFNRLLLLAGFALLCIIHLLLLHGENKPELQQARKGHLLRGERERERITSPAVHSSARFTSEIVYEQQFTCREGTFTANTFHTICILSACGTVKVWFLIRFSILTATSL